MALESSPFPTGENMRGSSLTIKERDMECILRPMVLSTMETGNTGSSTVKESTLGLTGENMRDSSLTM